MEKCSLRGAPRKLDGDEPVDSFENYADLFTIGLRNDDIQEFDSKWNGKRSSKKNASMIVGISMGQEICLIVAQVSLNLLYWKKNLQTDICGPGEINEKTAYIQARSFMARTLEGNGEECQAEGEAKMVE